MFPRNLAPRLLEALKDTPAVFLAGGRQSGKTTLARALSEAGFPARYLSLDDPTARAAAERDPAAFLADLAGPTVLDEVQQAPSIFPLLRKEIDSDRRPGRLLLTGSAQILMLPRLAEVLVGRMEVLRLWPLSQGEVEGVREGFIDAVFAPSLPPTPIGAGDRGDALARAVRGGYPEVLERKAARRSAWFRSFVNLLLQRDVRELANIERLSALPRLLELLAARASTLLNLAEVSRSAGIPQTSLKRYLALLEGIFLVTRLPAWAANPSKRLVRSPKLCFVDTGLLAQLAGLGPDTLRARPDSAGPLLENFVVAELTKQVGWSHRACKLHHFRTTAGREVDVVLEDDRRRLVGVEVKSSTSVSQADFSGLEALRDAAPREFHRGVVLYTGMERVAFGPDLHALPIEALWRMGAERVRRPVPA